MYVTVHKGGIFDLIPMTIGVGIAKDSAGDLVPAEGFEPQVQLAISAEIAIFLLYPAVFLSLAELRAITRK
jgi:hypothetical protein